MFTGETEAAVLEETTAQAETDPFAFPKLDLSNPTWDLFIIVFFVIAALLYGLSLGRDRIIVILVSIYMALAVVDAIPDFVVDVTLNDQLAFQLTTFIALFIALFFLISRSALMRTIGAAAEQDGRWYHTILFSFLHVGLLLSITMSFLPADIIAKFAPLTQTLFTHEWARFGWIASPILAMILFGSRQKIEK